MEIPINVSESVLVDDDEEQCLKNLSWGARLRWYLLCTALGFFCSAMGYVALSFGVYWKYSVLNTLGSLISLGGSFILKGPRAQLRYMFDDYRRAASAVYITSLVLSLVVAIYFKSFFLCLLCGIVQYVALIWYSLSFVPYGQEAVASCIRRVTGL
ncbi:hypothetical protein, conserved [Trypanosoma brucei gambiense DAL972]|uniref:Vesicle transport protein n=2 Tax=Trypanosoma brucei TaxID=5691 RepID=C9ZJ62_TRYB9|nr:hypothetical protein, conserved [Trypanosoma brucei gambiense DAL972]RHW73990.1 Got1/Sft2-like family [Trypanosoma brucei equiperdum]CBH09420.1 hypothetical protein, conserved [Trypanosoma brucei gambiense DAL972]|eukprot:XP_011771726.1 hypothetical protein, conserved [Trypanosoma brucei gambiense DAL972]